MLNISEIDLYLLSFYLKTTSRKSTSLLITTVILLIKTTLLSTWKLKLPEKLLNGSTSTWVTVLNRELL